MADDLEISDEELERRMRAKLLGKAPATTPARFNDEEQRIARRLLGTENARRIANAKEGRRIRPTQPVRITYEWYWVKGDHLNPTVWRINRVENGITREAHAQGRLEEDLDAALATLRAKGIGVIDANLDRDARKPKPAMSARKAALHQLRFFRV